MYLPNDEKKRFTVLYMFGGQTAFFDDTGPYGDSWRIGGTLDKLKAEIIVAAAEADREDRLTENSLFPFQSKYGSSEGKGEAYMDRLDLSCGKLYGRADDDVCALPLLVCVRRRRGAFSVFLDCAGKS